MKRTKYKVISYMIAMFMLMQTFSAGTISSEVVEGLSKEISFTIDKDYEGCSFDISVEKSGNFKVELYKGDYRGEIYEADISEGNNCTINVEDVKKGKWFVKVTEVLDVPVESETDTLTGDIDAESEETEDLTDHQEKERTVDDVIGKIKVNARAIDKTAFSIGNVSVARDIVGLKEYFKDDAIVVEWTDTSCGNVNIAIVDTKTNQILDKRTVEGMYYEFEIPELVNEISIDVVPSTSAGITGANTQFTRQVINDPDAEVKYEDKEYTNVAEIPVTVNLHKTYAVAFYVNGRETNRTGMLEAGNYTYDVPISEGVNEVLTYIIDKDYNMRSTSYTIIRDSIKPALTLDQEYDGLATYDSKIIISGTIKDYDTFTINETEPVVTGDGTFTSEYLLHDGVNTLNILATDIAGNETLYVAEITKQIKEEPVIPIFAYPVGLILLFGIIYKVYTKKKEAPEKPKKEKKPQKEKGNKNMRKLNFNLDGKKKLIIECVAIMVVIYLFFTNVILYGGVPSASMSPTLNKGDFVIVNGLAYIKNEPQRGDIIVFRGHEDSIRGQKIIKRVVGLPGDSIQFIDGYIYINGQLVYEEYIGSDVETNSFLDYEDIPEGCYFVMGDNREDSWDSRYWENPYVTEDEIYGKMITSVPVSHLINTVKNLF